MTSLTTEELNFLRMVKLVSGLATGAVRSKFDAIFPPSSLDARLLQETSKINQLVKIRVLSQKQKGLLLNPPGGTSSSENYDLTLLICLIRNLSPKFGQPKNGFDKLPPTSEISDPADLARIKFYRNKFAHYGGETVSIQDFNNYWTDLEGAIVRLGGQAFKVDCDRLRHETLNKDILLDFKRSLQDQEQETREIKEDLKNLKEARQLSRDERKTKLKEDTKLLVQNYITDNTFVETNIVEDGISCLVENGIVVITGRAGSGKTRNGLQLLNHVVLNDEIYDMMTLDSVDDFESLVRADDRVVVLIDDIFGKTNSIFSEEKHCRLLEMLHVYVSRKHVKVILTIRNTVMMQCKEVLMKNRLFSSDIILDLHSTKYEMSNDQKCQLMVNYFMKRFKQGRVSQKDGFVDGDGNCRISVEEAEIIFKAKPLIGFPEAVYMFVSSDKYLKLGSLFFSRPSAQVVEEIDNIRIRGYENNESRTKYAILCYTAFTGNRLNVDEKDLQKNIQSVVTEIYDVKTKISKTYIMDTLHQLKDVYLIKSTDGTYYEFQHQILLESVLFTTAKINITKIIPFMNWRFIVEMVRGEHYKEEEGEIVLKVSSAKYSKLAQKLIDIIMSFTYPEWRIKCIESIMKCGLFQSCDKSLVQYCLDSYEQSRPADLIDLVFYSDINKSTQQMCFKRNSFLPALFLRHFSCSMDTKGQFLITLEFISHMLKKKVHMVDPEEVLAYRMALTQSVYSVCSKGTCDLLGKTIKVATMNKILMTPNQNLERFTLHSPIVKAEGYMISVQECICQSLMSENFDTAEYLCLKCTDESFDLQTLIFYIQSIGKISRRAIDWLIAQFEVNDISQLMINWNNVVETSSMPVKSDEEIGMDFINKILQNETFPSILVEQCVLHAISRKQLPESEPAAIFLIHLAHHRTNLESFDKQVIIKNCSQNGYFKTIEWFFKTFPNDSYPVNEILFDACRYGDKEAVGMVLDFVDHRDLKIKEAIPIAVSAKINKEADCEQEEIKHVELVVKLCQCLSDENSLDVSELANKACDMKRFKIIVWILNHFGVEGIERDVYVKIFKKACLYDEFDIVDIMIKNILSAEEASNCMIWLVSIESKSSFSIPKNQRYDWNPMYKHFIKQQEREETARTRKTECFTFLLQKFDYEKLDLKGIMERSLRQEEFNFVLLLLTTCDHKYFDMQIVLDGACRHAQIAIVKKIVWLKKYKKLDFNEAMMNAVVADMNDIYEMTDRIAVIDLLWNEGDASQFDWDLIILKALAWPKQEIIKWILDNIGKTKAILTRMTTICSREANLDMLKYIFYFICSKNMLKEVDIGALLVEVCNSGSLYPNICRGDLSLEQIEIIKFLFKCFSSNFFDKYIPTAIEMAWKSKNCKVLLYFLQTGHCGNLNLNNFLQKACKAGDCDVVHWILINVTSEQLDVKEAFKCACNGHTFNEKERFVCLNVLYNLTDKVVLPIKEGYVLAKEGQDKLIEDWLKSLLGESDFDDQKEECQNESEDPRDIEDEPHITDGRVGENDVKTQETAHVQDEETNSNDNANTENQDDRKSDSPVYYYEDCMESEV